MIFNWKVAGACKASVSVLKQPHILGGTCGNFWRSKNLFRYLSRFIFIFSFIIGSACTPNVTYVSLMIIFFSSFISLSYLWKYTTILIVIFFFKFRYFSFDCCFFIYFLFCWGFISFQFNSCLLICIYIRYFDSVLVLLIFYFFSLLFFQSFYVFQFYFSNQVY